MTGMTTRRPALHRSPRALGLASVLAFGCTLPDENLGEVDESTSGADDSATEAGTDDGVSGQADATAGSETGETDGDPTECVDGNVNIPECHEDVDGDEVRLLCDNDTQHFNPSQADRDNDGVGDEGDLCPTVPSSNNTADSDKDGIGNDCDACRRTTEQYNEHDGAVSVPDYMFVRNVPTQADFDQDGIGDACDNCVALANCEGFGPDNPHVPGDPIADDDPNLCQSDDDDDLVGDLCEGQMLDGAAGPVGLGDADDFDQDGLLNPVDACPRQPVEAATCDGPEDCQPNSECIDDRCNHVDTDSDSVGDECDTCPSSPNPMQTMDGAAQADDPDGDFVGEACETISSCSAFPDPPPIAYYEFSALGRCCTVQLVEDADGDLQVTTSGRPLVDPDGLPVRVDCDEAGGTCRLLVPFVAAMPGVLTPPPGCAEVLGAVDPLDNRDMRLEELTTAELTAYACTMPQWDQDLDGRGDACDLCPFAYDPDNQAYIDQDGTVWPNDGKYCNGEYSPDALCDASE
jgi:hypothetical protein